MVPEQSIAIYKHLFVIEVGLREFIIDALGDKFGALWWKTRLPPDVLKSFRDGRNYEKGIKWFEIIPHHPLYYVEFPDLKKIIQRSDNWRDAFEPVLKNKDVVITTLTELEPIRNKISHNRKTSDGDLAIVEAAQKKLAAAVGEGYLAKLASRCTLALDIRSHIFKLQAETELAFQLVKECKAIEVARAYEIMQNWWFDEAYLNLPIGGIKNFFEAVAAYSRLPRPRGSGHKIIRWLKDINIDNKFDKAVRECSAILNPKERI
jgi:hypothetical protein